MNMAKSLVLFGIYMIVVGLTLLVAPDPVITFLGFEAVDDVWVRLFGWMVVSGGYIYIQVGRSGNEVFARATLLVRLTVVVVHLVLFLLDLAPAVLLTFGSADFVGALWTAMALRRDNA